MFTIQIDDNPTLHKFFKKFSMYEKDVLTNLRQVLPVFILEKPYKIKTAYGLKYKGSLIYEYKIKVNRSLNFRAAYTLENHTIWVVFISETTIKKDFVALLSLLHGVH